MGFKKTVTLALFASGLAIGSTAQAELLYNITDLGSLGGNIVYYEMGINDSGQVTGTYTATDGKPRAFITNSSGQITDLFPSITIPSYGNDINASGQVTGYAGGFAFVTDSNGQMISLGSLPGGVESIGRGINASGQVTGQIYISDNHYPALDNSSWHTFVTNSNGQMTDLGAYSIGTAINDLGQVAGYSAFIGNSAFVTNSNGQKIGVGSLGGCCSDGAYGINASGQVTGEANTAKSNDLHAFTSDSNAQMVDLGTLGGHESWGYDINDSGQVTGFSTTANGDQHAFVTDNGVMKDLNLS
jgi:probable HAF family extracellular repeat protein